MKSALLLFLFVLAGCEDDKAQAERLRQQAIEREVEARVAARSSRAPATDQISTLRVAVYGATAIGGLLLLHFLGAPGTPAGEGSSTQQGDRPPRSGGRFLDLNHHESPPRR